VAPDIEHLDSIEYYGLDVGLNASFLLQHNFQVFSHAGVNTHSSKILNAGVGIKVLF
jgi:hypothetical protein